MGQQISLQGQLVAQLASPSRSALTISLKGTFFLVQITFSDNRGISKRPRYFIQTHLLNSDGLYVESSPWSQLKLCLAFSWHSSVHSSAFPFTQLCFFLLINSYLLLINILHKILPWYLLLKNSTCGSLYRANSLPCHFTNDRMDFLSPSITYSTEIKGE
jgi:hypothetical protein